MKKPPNVTIIAFGGAYLVLMYYLLMALLKGGQMNMIYAALLISPFLLLWLNTLRDYWVGMFFGCFAFWITKVPIPLFDAFSFYGVLIIVFMGFYLLDIAMTRKKIFLQWPFAYKILICYALLITLRILSDPPASARLGGVGGLSAALPYFLGGWAFPLLYWAAGFVKNWKQTVRVIVVISLVAYVWLEVYLRFRGVQLHDTAGLFYALSFTRELYFIFCLLLTWAGSKAFMTGKRRTAFVWVSAGLLILSVVRDRKSVV